MTVTKLAKETYIFMDQIITRTTALISKQRLTKFTLKGLRKEVPFLPLSRAIFHSIYTKMSDGPLK